MKAELFLLLICIFFLDVSVLAQADELTQNYQVSMSDTIFMNVHPNVHEIPIGVSISEKLQVGDSIRAELNDVVKNSRLKLDSILQPLNVSISSKFQRQNRSVFKAQNLVPSRIDTINAKISRSQQQINATSSKITRASTAVAGQAERIMTGATEKISKLVPNGAAQLPNLPGVPSMPGSNLPSSDGIALPQVGLPSTDASNLALPTTKALDIEMPKNLSTENLKGLNSANVPKLDKLELPGYADKLPDVGTEIKGYQEKIKDIDPSKFNEEQLEEKVASLDQFSGVKQQIDLGDQAKRYFDPEVAKEEMLNKAKEVAVNHFAGHEEELKTAMEQLSKLKSKIPDPEGVIDLFAKRQNTMKGKCFAERLIPGIALQFQNSGSFWLDLNPYIGYKAFDRWVTGIGWNERMAYNFHDNYWDKENRIYGPRFYVGYKFKRNIWLKAEAEVMNGPVRATQQLNSDIIGRAWIASYFAGIKRDIDFGRRLKSNIQVLYNIYNPDKRSPYSSRLNVRMGIELPSKKSRETKPSTK